jgi:hypothetical protein
MNLPGSLAPGTLKTHKETMSAIWPLARAEALTGDRIVAENYFQHAEHYFRSMGENPN